MRNSLRTSLLGTALFLSGSWACAQGDVADQISTPDVDVVPISDATLQHTGLLPYSVTGLPTTLWSKSDGDRLAEQLTALPVPRLPALQNQLHDLLLAEARPPIGARNGIRFLAARVDTLLSTGAVEEAGALLDRVDTRAPELVARAFDISLMIGTENTACARIDGTTVVAPSLAARVLCLARGGDWQAAALAFETGLALDSIPKNDAALLERFLHPEFAEEAGPLDPPTQITPLRFRMYESLGEPLPTDALPLPYAVSDLRGVSGWKAQMTAAERLAQAGALPANRLLAVYTDRRPAASGGIWERASAVQALDKGLQRRSRAAVTEALPEAWTLLRTAGLGGTLAQMFGQAVWDMGLSGTPGDIAFDMALLTDSYERAAGARRVSRPVDSFLIALAKGRPGGGTANSLQALAIRDAFDMDPPNARQDMLSEGRLGEAILAALEDLSDGADTAPANIRSGLATLRAAGLENTARRAALELLLLSDEPV